MIVQMRKTTQLGQFEGGRHWEGCPQSLSAARPFPQPLVVLSHFPVTAGTLSILWLHGLPCPLLPFQGCPAHWPYPALTLGQGPCLLCISVSSALSMRPCAGRCSVYTLVKAQGFKLCSALISLQKKKKKWFLWSNKFGKHRTRHPLL